MTPQQIEALKLALEALKKCHYYMIDAGLPNQSLLNEAFTAYKALEEALAILVNSYKAMGMTALSNDARRVLQTNFPKSAFLLTDGAEVKRSGGWRLW